MSEDFLRLDTPQLMDPFFDDDEDVPDSAFGRPNHPGPMDSQASGLPLTRNAVPPAGSGPSKSSGDGVPQGWNFDDEDFRPADQQTFAGSGSFNGSEKKTALSPRKKWKWPWQKDKVLTGDRVIALNNAPANVEFGSNFVSTSKYNIASFMPKFLTEQFSKYANLFFLFTACIQQVPGVSPTQKYTTIVPLGVVLLASAWKEFQEDLKRHQSDAELNARLTKVLTPESTFVDRKWKDIRVGDVVRLESDDFIPADMILVSSSEPEGLCYIETSNLDGETNLKIKQASTHTSSLTAPPLVNTLRGSLRCEQPNNSLYTFEGTLDLITSGGLPKQVPLGPDQVLLRGAQVRNTPWVYGIAVYTGHETKLMRNATAAPIKRTAVERQVNVQIVFLFILLLALSIGSSIGGSIRAWFFASQQWYLSSRSLPRAGGFIEVCIYPDVFPPDILTFIILYNNLIPISLIVTMEFVKFQQARLINSDLDMYYARTDTPALCRTSSLVEELGQIEYVFSDKTGTLTCNEMEFRCCSIAGVAYSEVVEEGSEADSRTFTELRTLLGENQNPFVDVGAAGSAASAQNMEREVLNDFLTLLAVCHTVIPEVKDGKTIYQASSPDEAALVAGAELLGYQFHTRKPKSVFVNIQGQSQQFDILNVCEFNSTRKRMSTVVRMPNGKIKIYCKGADTVILERLSKNQPYTEKTLAHLEDYATEGLRTLCLAYRDIPEQEYRQWAAIYDQRQRPSTAAELIEKDLFLLGATAIEDKLQDGVPDTIHTLQMAGIKVWVLTGDRQETAINIGMSADSSRRLSSKIYQVIVNEDNANDTQQFISKRLSAIKSQRSTGELEDLALVIGPRKELGLCFGKEISKIFLELAIMCKAVICCRVSPLQKALVVKLVKKNQKAILLAIGDGANDVSMIQAAHVGVGISGVEGLQAARSADVAISQFRFLKKLLLVHGAWSYRRLSKLILVRFAFFNNFSGQIAYESWTLSMYNVLFSLLPPLVIGIFDQFVSAPVHPGQKNAFFTKTAFWMWVANALYHSLLLYGFSIVLFWGDLKQSTGYDSGHWYWGVMLYLAVLLTVLGKAALISDLWTKYTVAAIPGSFIFTMVFLPLYALITPEIGFSQEYQGLVPRLWTDWIFYLVLLLIPTFCLSRDFVWKYYRRTYMPSSFQKAIKKVRAVQRMRRNRGFAFSQTEDGGKQDQARLIRAYDTSKSNTKPSGY
ncbi:aminophospholipid-transporting P-type ATPase [Mycena leptocephala]|nr:aminophospholipid-transporting P-type ATPase [Mycena leptocephala]